MKQKLLVLLDNGHGKNTAGKRSPKWEDGTQLFEYEFNRDIVERIAKKLGDEEIEYKILVPEITDISLSERCRRANHIYDKLDGKCFLISIHANAGGGTGWECWTSKGQTASDEMAEMFFLEATKEFVPGWKMRSEISDGDHDKESQFYILKHTKCPAILTENFFMDTEKDCRLIMNDYGRDRIACAHFNAIKKIVL